jgi:hypothetical protein
MSIGTILLIGGAVTIMFLLHRFGHAGHSGSHGAHGDGGTVTAANDGRGLVGAQAPIAGPNAEGPIGHGDHVGDGEEGHASAGQRPKKHGCC